MTFLKKPLVLVFIIGILIRLVASFTTFHPDVVHFDLAGYVLSRGNLLNFYDYTFSLEKNDPFLRSHPVELFNYPPSVYFSIGLIDSILTGFVNSGFHDQFLFHYKDTFGNPQLFLHLFLLKLPYFIFDLSIALLLYGIFKTQRDKSLAVTLWMFNPLAIYSTFMMGQFDIIPTFFTILALKTALVDTGNFKKRMFLSAFYIGLGTSFKIFPILFLIPLALVFKDWINRTTVIVIGLATYFLTILPFLYSQGFRTTALVANQTLKTLYAQIPISGGESIVLFLSLIGFLYLIFLYSDNLKEDLWQKFFIILLPFFIFTHYHPQWFLWLTPFLIIELIRNNFKHVFVIQLMLLSFLGGVLMFESSLSIGLFSPIFPNLFEIQDIWTYLGIGFERNFMRSLFHSTFVVCAVFFLYKYFPGKER